MQGRRIVQRWQNCFKKLRYDFLAGTSWYKFQQAPREMYSCWPKVSSSAVSSSHGSLPCLFNAVAWNRSLELDHLNVYYITLGDPPLSG